MREVDRIRVGEITVVVYRDFDDHDYALVDWAGEAIEPAWRLTRTTPWTLAEARGAGIEHAQRLAGPDLQVYRTKSGEWTGVMVAYGTEIGRVAGCASIEEVEIAAIETWGE